MTWSPVSFAAGACVGALWAWLIMAIDQYRQDRRRSTAPPPAVDADMILCPICGRPAGDFRAHVLRHWHRRLLFRLSLCTAALGAAVILAVWAELQR